MCGKLWYWFAGESRLEGPLNLLEKRMIFELSFTLTEAEVMHVSPSSQNANLNTNLFLLLFATALRNNIFHFKYHLPANG